MEKQIGSKEVKMTPVRNNEQTQKLTYEELNQACADMSQQVQQQGKYIQQMHSQLQQMNYALQTKRLDYLFKVIEMYNKGISICNFDSDFVQECISEIQKVLTIPKEKAGQEEQEENNTTE